MRLAGRSGLSGGYAFPGNPIAMAAGYAMLTYLNEHPEVYKQLENSGSKLVNGFRSSMEKLGLKYTLNQIGSMYTLFFTPDEVTDFPSC